MNRYCIRFLVVMLLPLSVAVQLKAKEIVAWTPASFSLKTSSGEKIGLQKPCYPFPGKKNGVVRVAPELANLTGIKYRIELKIGFKENVNLLIALPKGEKPLFARATLVLDSALSITGMPAYQLYSVAYTKGEYTIRLAQPDCFVAGVVKASQTLNYRNAGMPDGRLWHPYITDGYTDSMQLFDIIPACENPVIDEGMVGTEEIQGGFEGGTCVKVNGKYHLFPTERAGEPGMEAYYDRVKTRIGHWESPDALHWKRVGTVYQASGNYAVCEEDNPMNDRRGAIWSYNAVFNEKEDRWYGYYLTYTVDKNIKPNHSFGRIWCTKSQTKGMEGIGGPYPEGQLIMEPGLDSQPWEGRQGVASFYPYPVKEGWLAFYAGAFPYKTWADYPRNSGTGWLVGLAKAKTMDGPWTRLDTAINPVKSIHPQFVENPLVYRMPNGIYLALFDGGPDQGEHRFANMIGYTVSKDGLHWSEARYIPLHTKVRCWWNTMRTPLCLIPEGDGVYTILYAAVASKRFHPIGMFRVRLHLDLLQRLADEL
jgi:hypothetical protein